MDTDIDQLRQLPVADKLRIVGQLWDDIHDSDAPLVLSSEQRDEVDRRAAELDANPEIALTREELWKRIDESNG